MIVAFINGKKAYPSTGTGVKVTLENPFIKEGEERTMEVVFPFSIPENYSIFGSLNRIDTSFDSGVFEDCAIVVDNIEVVRGKGRVTTVTKDELKLQIRGGSSSMRFKESFKNIFIDTLYYGSVESRHEFLGRGLDVTNGLGDLSSDYNRQGFVGSPGKYAFLPVYDESNDMYVNTPCICYTSDGRAIVSLSSWRKAVQPNLMWVLKKVMERIGYTIKENYYDRDPWAKLYVCSARQSLNLAKALPHWSVYTFLDEFRKLFNATFIFNDGERSVRIIPFNESALMDTVEYEATEDFDATFDEDGIEYLGSSNLEFELSGSERLPDCLTEDILGAFTVEEYASKAAASQAFLSKLEKTKLTTIFKFPGGYAYGRPAFDDEGNLTSVVLTDCGWFSPLIRKEGGSNITLRMVPVAMSWHDEALCYMLSIPAIILTTLLHSRTKGQYIFDEEKVFERFPFSGLIANMECDETYNSWGEREDIDLGYTSVADVIEDGGSVPSNSESQDPMELIFAGTQTVQRPCGARQNGIDYSPRIELSKVQVPVGYTDYRMVDMYNNTSFTASEIHVVNVGANSLSLNVVPGASTPGNFHNSGTKIRRTIDGNNQVKIPFICNGKPDVTKKFLFRNKLYICAKVEMNVTGEGIDRLKTGYFYELLG